MKENNLIIKVRGNEIIRGRIATSFIDKTVGMIGKKNIDFAILFKRANWIHCFFMKEPIDILYLNKKNEVVQLRNSFKPWRMDRMIFNASQVLELPQNTIKQFDIKVNDIIEFEEKQ